MANPNFKLASPEQADRFFQALETDNVTMLRTVIKENPKILQWQRLDGLTPLHTAASGPNLRVAEVLLSIGYDVNVPYDRSIYRKNEYTPLHEACGGHEPDDTGSVEMVRFLVKRGANVNAGAGLHDTPLHRTAWRNNYEAARFLLESGANPNWQDHDGLTPLARAIERKNLDVEKVLRNAGAEVTGTPLVDKKLRVPRSIDLATDAPRIEKLIIKAIRRYVREHNDEPLSALALQASGVSGFVSVCLDTERFQGDVPSMKYYGYETRDFHSWQQAYEAHKTVRVKTTKGRQLHLETNDDERYDKPFYEMIVAVLRSLVRDKKFHRLPRKKGFQLGIEFLEGTHGCFWKYR